MNDSHMLRSVCECVLDKGEKSCKTDAGKKMEFKEETNRNFSISKMQASFRSYNLVLKE